MVAGGGESVAQIPSSVDRRAPTADDALINKMSDHVSVPLQDHGREARPPK